MVHNVNSPYSLETAFDLRRSPVQSIVDEQMRRLQAHLMGAAQIPFYREMFTACGCDPSQVTDMDIFRELPFTTRQDLDRQPELFGHGDQTQMRDVAVTSGTTGRPVVVPYTAGDLHRLAFNEAIAFHSAGLRKGDKVLLTVTLDRCFIAGLAYYSGVTFLGGAAVRSGPGQPTRQWQLIDQLQPRIMVGVPTFLAELGRWGQDNGIDVRGSSVDTIITIGEPARKADFSLTRLGCQLQEAWGAAVYSSYGATEFETAFGECSAAAGGHVHPELMVVEIVDDNGNILPDGIPGEVVVTPLGVEGFPLVRFRTGDIARLYSSSCSCGWNTPRLGPVEGRLAQRLKCRGTTLYPETIFHALQDHMQVQGAYVEVRSAADGVDDVTVVVGCDDMVIGLEAIQEKLQAHLRFRPKVVIRGRKEVEAVMIGEGGRKPRNFFDFRS